MTRRDAVLLGLLIGLPTSPCLAASMFDDGYKPCGDAPSTLAVVACIDRKAGIADKRLNAAYVALQRAADPDQRKPLVAAQRLWIQYRDANCGFYGAADGAVRSVKAAECRRMMTGTRAAELEGAAAP